MNREKLFSFLWSWVLAFAVSFGAVGSVITAFHMEVSLTGIALWCLGAATFCCLCYSLPLGPLPISVLALVCGFLWQQGALRSSFEALLYRLTRQYHQAYDWDIIKLNHLTADDMELQLWLSLSILGVLIAMGISWAVCRKKTALPGLLPAALLLGSCMVVTDTVPAAGFLFLLFFGALILLLTGAVRRQDGARGNRLSTMLALPVAVSVLLLFAAIPENNYQGKEPLRKLADQVMDYEPVARLFGRASTLGTTGSSVDSSIVDLKTVGVRIESNAEIMQVLTDYDSTLYLRGRALDSYNGQTWTSSGMATDGLYWPDESATKTGGEVMITTKYAHRMRYLPYYVSSIDMNNVTKGVENTSKLTQYSYSCRTAYPQGSSTMTQYLSDSMTGSYEDYLHLSSSVKKWAEPLARKITAGETSTYGKALAIRDYVQNSAKYDTNTHRMPASGNDFVRWFLEDSDTGYCVHFASAATVLLQASGIPARYVTGYTVTANSGYVTVVRAKDSHAWAEYWLPGYGWVVLEATPAEEPDPIATETTGPDNRETTATTPSVPNTEAQRPTTDPSAKPKTNPTNLLRLLWIPFFVVAGASLVILQRSVRLHLRRKRLRSGSANVQALQLWQELVYLARLLGDTPDRSMLELAQKAKFSQHTISEAELRMFRWSLENAHKRLKKRSVFHQLYYRLILVVY